MKAIFGTTGSAGGTDRPWDDVERAALVALLRTRPERMTWQEIAAEVSAEGRATAVWEKLVPSSLFGAEESPREQAMSDIESWRVQGIGFLTFLDPDYPTGLREIHEMPPVLFYRGSLRRGERAVSVVGSRAASDKGLKIAATVSRNLVQRDITVLSGLAKGIDTAAHTAALEAGGRTVACIGTGISRCYPAANSALQEQIAQDGLVLSQFWPDAPPRQQNFPMRNAVMSGYGHVTIIVEAGEKSGARIQARQAVAHGRQVVLTDFVVDGNEWARKLVGRPGVHVAESTKKIMEVVEHVVFSERSTGDLLDQLISLRGGLGHRQ
ncbi:DNA-processing protein DprA [Saccharopolyspora taberi]|uniref:Smf/DprA SLOG domain-containing protein n=1 Tax=Saccharopolyspora taberi TaxID=60895 RepID=A0ABN3V2S4_9PSEU